MTKRLGSCGLVLAMATLVNAHFVYIVPDGKEGKTAKIILSDDLNPDERIDAEKIAKTKLWIKDGSSVTEVTWKKDKHHLNANLPGSGDGRIVFSQTDYGVLQKGDAKPFHLVYFAKSVTGSAGTAAPLGEKVDFEVATAVEGGKIRFRTLVKGSPKGELEVTVKLPDGKSEKVTSDKDGHTPSFEAKGRYAVTARWTESTAGEKDGKKFEEVRRYATLVVDFGTAK